MDDEQQHGSTVLLFDETESDAPADRLPADASSSSISTVSLGWADSSALTAKHQRVVAVVPAVRGGARRAACEHDVDTGLELYGANGRLVHWFWPFLLEAAEAFAHAGWFIRDVLWKTRGTAVSAGWSAASGR